MEIRYAKIALKALQGYDRATRDRIRGRIAAGLTKTPPIGDIKPLSGEESVYRLRVGNTESNMSSLRWKQPRKMAARKKKRFYI